MFLLALLYNGKSQLLDSKDKIKTKLNKVLILICLMIMCCLPSAYRANQLIGIWAPFGSTYLNQIYMQSGKRTIKFDIMGNGSWEFSSPSLYQNPFEGLYDKWTSKRDGVVSFSINTFNREADWESALKDNWAGWKTYSRMVLENIIFLLFSSSWMDNNPEHYIENLNAKMRWVWAPLLFIVAITNIFYFIKKRCLSFFPCLVLFAWAICLFSPSGIMEGRYRKPLEGLLITNSLWLWVQLKKKQSNIFKEERIISSKDG